MSEHIRQRSVRVARQQAIEQAQRQNDCLGQSMVSAGLSCGMDCKCAYEGDEQVKRQCMTHAPQPSIQPRGTLPAREVIRHALIDAIECQNSLAQAYPSDDPAHHAALDLERQYRAMLKRRFGTDRTPIERATDGRPTIDVAGFFVIPEQRMQRQGASHD